MGIVTGLTNINKKIAREPREESYKVNWFKAADGESVRIRFLQELDAEAEGYDAAAGLGFLAVEHESPENFKRRALCTIDEGACRGCEEFRKGEKGFKQKVRLYVNVLAERGDKSEVAVLAQGNGPKSVTPWLIEYAGDNKTITGGAFKLKRSGAGANDTGYTLTPQRPDEKQYDVTKHELFDLHKVVRKIPYEKQDEFYMIDAVPVSDNPVEAPEESEW